MSAAPSPAAMKIGRATTSCSACEKKPTTFAAAR
jgi:hypothetical protein